VKDVARTLGLVARRWLDADDSLRGQTVQALQVSTGFRANQIERALSNAFEELRVSKLRSFVAQEIRTHDTATAGVCRTVLHILPSNVFTAWLPAAVTTLLLGHRCLLKPSAGEPVFAPAWKRSIAQEDPVLAELVEIVAWNEDLLHIADAVIVYGSGDTIASIQSRVPSGTCFVGYGHKLSVGVIFREAWEEERTKVLEALRRDLEPFGLAGCLSPQILFVEGGTLSQTAELQRALPVMPRIEPFGSLDQVHHRLAILFPYMSELGYAGPSSRLTSHRAKFEALGITRICPIGQMQKPPLTWRNGGISLVDTLGALSCGGVSSPPA
jgi:hypothetical protein